MESDVILWSTLAKLVVENKTTLFSAVVWAAIIGGGVSIWNSWRDRKSRERINKEALELQHQLKIEELIKNREIKEFELKSAKELKQLEINSRVFDVLLNEFLKSMEVVNEGICSFNVPLFTVRVERLTDIMPVMSGLSLLMQKTDIKNKHYEEMIKKIKNLKFCVHQFADYKYKLFKAKSEVNFEDVEYKLHLANLYDATDGYNEKIKEYLSYYYH